MSEHKQYKLVDMAGERDALHARLHDLERAAWRVLDLVASGAVTATDGRVLDAVVSAFDSLESALAQLDAAVTAFDNLEAALAQPGKD